MFKKNRLPTIIVTGASGFIGRYFLEYIKEDYNVIAIARRSSTEAGVPFHPHINWVQWDISNKRHFYEVLGYVMGKGGADYMVHLAAYYDYEYDDNPEYERTNITGTKNVMELAKKVNVKHYLFASSMTVCKFPLRGEVITETSPANADFAYGLSKKAGEEMGMVYSQYFKCSMIRFAAVYSDWCEFAPLYKFMSTWLAKKWDSRFLGGKGESAISYIHIHDLSRLMISIIKNHERLPAYSIYLASPDGSTSHKELFYTATRDFYGKAIKSILLPRPLTFPGLLFKQTLGKLGLIAEPYEKFWMLRYIDHKLEVDASYTREVLEWEPTPRYHILRRLLFLLEKLKSHHNLWHLRNEAVLKIVTHRANLTIYEQMIREQDAILEMITTFIRSPENVSLFPSYTALTNIDFQSMMSTLYHLLMAAVRSGDRSLMIKYIDDISLQRFVQGFELKEIIGVLDVFDDIITTAIQENKVFKGLEQELYDYISLTLQLARDEIEDVYENLENKLTQYKIADMPLFMDPKKREDFIKKLSAFYQDSTDEQTSAEEDNIPDEMKLNGT